KQLPKRNEVEVKHTWNVHSIYANDQLFEQALQNLENKVETFNTNFEGKVKDSLSINMGLDALRSIQEIMVKVSAYAQLQSSADSTSEENQMRVGKTMLRLQKLYKKLDFFESELKDLDEETLLEASKNSSDNEKYLLDFIEYKKHLLTKEAEKVLTALSPVLNAPYQSYNRFKLVDMKFNDFTIDGVNYP